MSLNPSTKPLALTFREAGRLAGRDPRTISKAVRMHQIPTILIAGKQLIPREAFTRYLTDGCPFDIERAHEGGLPNG